MDKADIDSFAYSISKQPIGLATYAPESWASQSMCFHNVYTKVERSGGRVQFGWMFQPKIATKISETSKYITAIHHAVWHDTSTGRLFDVTPFHNEVIHHPLTEKNHVVFLVDDNAKPVMANGAHIPLPCKFYSLDKSKEMAAYIDSLIQQEQEAHKRFLNLDVKEGEFMLYHGAVPEI